MGGYEDYLREQVGDRWFRYNPRLTCIYCCKSFNQKGSLDRHMRLHMGITPFVCRICGKKYTRKDQLEYHIRKHTGNKPFHCHVCGKSFPFQAILNQHFRKNHPGCAPQEVSHSASPETTTVTSRGGQNEGESPSQEDAEGNGGGGGAGSSFGEGVQPSVSTTGPDWTALKENVTSLGRHRTAGSNRTFSWEFPLSLVSHHPHWNCKLEGVEWAGGSLSCCQRGTDKIRESLLHPTRTENLYFFQW